MAPIKFEENIKEKLEQRTLQPSSQAWNRLSEKLDKTSKISHNNTYMWLGIAAGFVGILFIVNVFFKPPKTSNIHPILVDTESKKDESTQSKNVSDTEKKIIKKDDFNVAVTETSDEKPNAYKNKTQPRIVNNNQITNTIVTDAEAIQESKETNKNLIVETPSIETTIAETSKQEKTDRDETDIDALLKKAQQELSKKTDNKRYAIDAQSLLQDVEDDIDESFRDKVFETLITGYKKVKTAVVQRND